MPAFQLGRVCAPGATSGLSSAVWQHFFNLLGQPFSLLLSCSGPNIIMHMSRVPPEWLLLPVVLRQTLARHYAAPFADSIMSAEISVRRSAAAAGLSCKIVN